MPAKRLPWVKLWIEAAEHEKIALLPDPEYRTWTLCLLRGSQQPTRWRFASVQHAALVTHRPVKHVRTLIAARLLDEREDGVWVHDAPYWQDRHPSDFAPRTVGDGSDEDAGRVRETSPDRSANTPPTLREDSAKTPRTLRRDRERDSEGDGDGAGAPSAGAPVPDELQAFHDSFAGLRGYAPTPAFFAKVGEKYRHLDLEEEAIKIRSWLSRHAKRSCSTDFLLNWLKTAAQEAAAAPIAPLPSKNGAHRNGRISESEAIELAYQRDLERERLVSTQTPARLPS